MLLIFFSPVKAVVNSGDVCVCSDHPLTNAKGPCKHTLKGSRSIEKIIQFKLIYTHLNKTDCQNGELKTDRWREIFGVTYCSVGPAFIYR